MVEKRIDIITTFRSNLKKIRENIRGFNDVIKQNMEGFKRSNKANVSMINSGGKLANQFRLLTHGLRGFRMEMLGVMFFGMGMARMFSGLLKPALQLVGVFELWNLTLGLVFLPTALIIQDLLLKFMDIMLSMPEPMQKALGIFVLLGLGIGKLLFTVGMLTLGLGSLAMAWGTIVTVVFPIVGVMTAVGAAVLILIGYWSSWTDISNEWKLGIKLIVLALSGLALVLGAPFVAIIAATVAAVMIGIDIFKQWGEIVVAFKNIWKNVFDNLPNPVKEAIDRIIGFFTNLADKFREVRDIIRAVVRLTPGVGDDVAFALIDRLIGSKPGAGGTEVINPEDMKIAVEEGFANALAKAVNPLLFLTPTNVTEDTLRITGEG